MLKWSTKMLAFQYIPPTMSSHRILALFCLFFCNPVLCPSNWDGYGSIQCSWAGIGWLSNPAVTMSLPRHQPWDLRFFVLLKICPATPPNCVCWLLCPALTHTPLSLYFYYLCEDSHRWCFTQLPILTPTSWPWPKPNSNLKLSVRSLPSNSPLAMWGPAKLASLRR